MGVRRSVRSIFVSESSMRDRERGASTGTVFRATGTGTGRGV